MNRLRGIWRSVVFGLAAALVAPATMPAAPAAAKEGVFIDAGVYFTLEQVWHAPGPDETWLRFDLRLHNGGRSPVDFNRYGARVTDADGRSYSVRLNGSQSARVPAGGERDFSYVGRLPGNIPADRLYVAVFRWETGRSARMRDLGSLSVAAALAESPARHPAVRIDLRQADASLPGETPVSFRLDGVYPVYENGEAAVLVTLKATNESPRVAAIPERLLFRLVAPDGRTYPASVVAGAEKPLLPGQTETIALSAPAGGLSDGDVPPVLRLVTSESGAETTVAELAPLAATKPATAGETVDAVVGGGKSQVAVAIEPAKTWRTDGGLVVRASVRIRNDGRVPVAVPSLSAQIQAPSLAAASEAADTAASHGKWIAPGAEERFSFAAVLPDGTPPDDVRLVLFEAIGGTQGGGRIPLLAAKPAGGAAAGLNEAARDYRFGEPMPVEIVSSTAGQMEVTLEDLKLFENGDGFPTAVATFRVTNLGRSAAAVPDFGTELVDARGNAYAGVRQTLADSQKQLAPGVGTALTYSYLLPAGGIGDTATLHVYDAGTVPSAKLTLGAFKVGFRKDENAQDRMWSFYPFAMEIRYPVAYSFVSRDAVSFGLNFDLQVSKQEQILVAPDLLKLKFDLVDGDGRLAATQTIPLAGTPSGATKIAFSNGDIDRFGSDFYVKVYAVVSTPNGELKRLLTEIRP